MLHLFCRAQMQENSKNLLEVHNFSLRFPANSFVAVNNISFDIYHGEILALVGESGSGKSLTALSILGLQPQDAITSGEIIFAGTKLDLNHYPRNLRGKRISYIPQDPLSALNPMYNIKDQLEEALTIHDHSLSKTEITDKLLNALKEVGIRDPEQCLKSYPHEISGGMRQRVMIAMAIINAPDLIIADEPTTALDVTVQAVILELLKSLNKTILFITHDLSVVAEIADRVLVMKRGQIVEANNVYEIFDNAQNAYTNKLLAAIPKL